MASKLLHGVVHVHIMTHEVALIGVQLRYNDPDPVAALRILSESQN